MVQDVPHCASGYQWILSDGIGKENAGSYPFAAGIPDFTGCPKTLIWPGGTYIKAGNIAFP